MTAAVQLSLDDALQVTCPKCGHNFKVSKAVRDTKLSMLSDSTRAVWEAAGPRFRSGFEKIGPTQLAARANVSPRTASYHLAVLVSVGLAQRIPQNHTRAQLAKHYPEQVRRVRHVYTGKPQ